MKYKLLKVPTRFSVVGGTEARRGRTAGKAGEPALGRPSVPSVPYAQLAFAVQCGNQRPVCPAIDPRDPVGLCGGLQPCAPHTARERVRGQRAGLQGHL